MKLCLGGQAVYSAMHEVCEVWAGSMYVMWKGEQGFRIVVLSHVKKKGRRTVVL